MLKNHITLNSGFFPTLRMEFMVGKMFILLDMHKLVIIFQFKCTIIVYLGF